MQQQSGYTVVSPIKAGGKRRPVGAHVDHDELDESTADGLIAGGYLAYADEIVEPDSDPDSGSVAAAAAQAAADQAADDQAAPDQPASKQASKPASKPKPKK